ncbi:MAG: serine/threonine-protein kinase [Isosphaeraceae bacterium]
MDESEFCEYLPVDEAVEQFQAAFRRGDRPRIEDFVARASPKDRAALRYWLIYSEIDNRIERGDSFTVQEYRDRFPEDRGTVGRAFLTLMLEDLNSEARGQALGRFRIAGYDVLGPAGRGGMGQVMKVREIGTSDVFAMKCPALPREGEEGERVRRRPFVRPSDLERFRREIRILRKLKHANIVPVHRVVECGGVPFLLMDYIDGEDLERLVKRAGRPAVEEAASIIAEVADALAFLHEKGFAHRDVKPSNIMIDPGNHVFLTDLGIAAKTSIGFDPAGDEQPLGYVSAGYVAPERLVRTESSDPRSDIYALGCTLYFLLTGRPPVEGEPDRQMLNRLRRSAFPSVRELRPEIPEDLARIVAKMMAPKLGERYQSVKSVADALFDFLNGVTAAQEAAQRRVRRIRKAKFGKDLPRYVSYAVFVALSLPIAYVWIQKGDVSWMSPARVLEPVPSKPPTPPTPFVTTERVDKLLRHDRYYKFDGKGGKKFIVVDENMALSEAEVIDEDLFMHFEAAFPGLNMFAMGLPYQAYIKAAFGERDASVKVADEDVYHLKDLPAGEIVVRIKGFKSMAGWKILNAW